MQTAPVPADEAERLRELYRYEVLDTATEQALDELVRSAASICGTTFSALTLIDRNRQWFKAQFGFSHKETGRSQSICGHGILTREFFEVPDTHADARFSENPLLEALGVRFYGGAQLVGSEGHVLGMLCVLDPEPHRLNAEQQAHLNALALRAMELLEAHRQRRRLEWLGALVGQVQDEIYLFDLNTNLLLHSNDAATHGGALEMARMGLKDVTPDVPPTELAFYMGQIRDGAAEVSYEALLQRGERRVPVEARWLRLDSSGHALAMCTLRDISQRKALDQAKDDFITAVNHDLRTPLTGLYGAIKLLDSGACGELPASAVQMIGLLSRNSDRLLGMVDEILSMEKRGRHAY